MLSALMLRAFLAAAGVAMLSGMMGTFVIWRRMSYMGDAMGHTSLLGVVAGLLLGVTPGGAVAVLAVLVGLLLGHMQRDNRLPFDALLATLSSGGLALGLVLFNWLPNRQVDLYGYLFGDILAISNQDLWLIYGVLCLQGLFIAVQWGPLLRMTVHPEIATVEGVNVPRLQLLMTVSIAVTVALALQVVGMLLITALLVIPALTARLWAHTPQQMLLTSMGAGVLACAGGISASWRYDLPVGATIVVTAVALFGVTVLFRLKRL